MMMTDVLMQCLIGQLQYYQFNVVPIQYAIADCRKEGFWISTDKKFDNIDVRQTPKYFSK